MTVSSQGEDMVTKGGSLGFSIAERHGESKIKRSDYVIPRGIYSYKWGIPLHLYDTEHNGSSVTKTSYFDGPRVRYGIKGGFTLEFSCIEAVLNI